MKRCNKIWKKKEKGNQLDIKKKVGTNLKKVEGMRLKQRL